MPVLFIRHHVSDFARWKAGFDEDGIWRRANGSRGGWLFRNTDDADEVLVLLEWDDLDRARLFADSDDLREALARAGVADWPDIWFLEEVDRPAV